MCGIAGILDYTSAGRVSEADIKKICDAMVHRGPDDEGYHLGFRAVDGGYKTGIGMRRLAIIDLETGRQPIYNEDKSVAVVLNGEIYNFRELRSELETRHRFSTKTDTETIAHLYEEMGEKCVERLRGMFAFAVWDEKRKKLFIARDRIGKKPLYYMSGGGRFVFASEIGACLKAAAAAPTVDAEALDSYLTYQYVPPPLTIYKQIRALLPATTLSVEADGRMSFREYWFLDFRPKVGIDFREACAETRRLLAEAVRLRMVSDVPLGAFLSGGHDSSIVTGLMSEVSGAPVKTFSIGFEDEEYSELLYARLVAGYFGTEHHEYILKPDYSALLPSIVKHYGQPFADSSALPTFLVSRETRKYVTVALNGDGGDEFFGGYLRYKAMKYAGLLSGPARLFGAGNFRRLASVLPSMSGTPFAKTARYARRLAESFAEPAAIRNINWHCIFSDDAKSRMYTEDFARERAAGAFGYMREIFDSAPAGNDLDRTFYTDAVSYLPGCLLVKVDIASMANSLEARSPFLDHKVMEFAASLPPSWKLRGTQTKYILKKTFENFLPPAITNRGKMGFGIPLHRWFRGEWKDLFRETALSVRALRRGYFREDAVQNLFDEHLSGRRDHGYRLWSLLMLEMWHRTYVDGERL